MWRDVLPTRASTAGKTRQPDQTAEGAQHGPFAEGDGSGCPLGPKEPMARMTPALPCAPKPIAHRVPQDQRHDHQDPAAHHCTQVVRMAEDPVTETAAGTLLVSGVRLRLVLAKRAVPVRISRVGERS